MSFDLVYAASSASYGDQPDLPKDREKDRQASVPIRSVKRCVNGNVCMTCFREYSQFKTIGLRYFNVFGERQRPRGERTLL